MKCENCIHYEACLPFYENIKMKLCDMFEDKDLYIKLPCKIGTEVFGVSTPCGGCEHYNNSLKEALNTCRCCNKKEVINFGFSYDCMGEFGKTVFLTKEEAEAALKKGDTP